MGLKIYEIDSGYCRIIYSIQNDTGQTVYYCLQDEGENYGGVTFYRCSGSPWFEPDYVVKCKDWNIVEIPNGDSGIEVAVRNHIKKKLKESSVRNHIKKKLKESSNGI